MMRRLLVIGLAMVIFLGWAFVCVGLAKSAMVSFLRGEMSLAAIMVVADCVVIIGWFRFFWSDE